MRVEDAGTFEAIHRLVKRLIAERKLQGLRLDHIDGLRDPAQYFQRLRRLIREGFENILDSYWLALVPGIAILIVIFALNLLGDGLRDAIDPKLKGEA